QHDKAAISVQAFEPGARDRRRGWGRRHLHFGSSGSDCCHTSEYILQRELQDAWIVRTQDSSDVGVRETRPRIVEYGVVQDVESLRARFDPMPLGDRETPHHSHVHREATRSYYVVPAGIPERPQRIRPERGWIEPLVERWIAHMRIGNYI